MANDSWKIAELLDEKNARNNPTPIDGSSVDALREIALELQRIASALENIDIELEVKRLGDKA